VTITDIRVPALVILHSIAFIAVNTDAQMISIPGGTFTMGSTDGASDEQPPRTVTLSPFTISGREITEQQYRECVTSGRCTPAHYDDSTCRAWSGTRFIRVKVPDVYRNPDFPVVCVTWQQARQYCRAYGTDLPSEAQWEYAARAGSPGPYPWGSAFPTAERSVYARKDGPEKTGSRSPNDWGLYDMVGNVWEWVSDNYDPVFYAEGPATDPEGPGAGFYRVIRGGGWYSTAVQLKLTNRQWYSTGYSEVSIGFRCAGK
jgi:formylglycine-generating enzyme